MQEQAKISRVIISDATLTTKSEPAQVPHNNHNNSSEDTEGKPARDNSDDITDIINRNSNRSCNTHPLKPSNFGANNNGKFVYDPGGHTPNSEDGSMHDVDDSAYGTTATNTHRSHDCDHDKTIVSPSDADAVSPIDFAQATCPVLGITSQPSADSRCADAMPRPCSLQCQAHTPAFNSTRTADADAVIKSSSSDCKITSNAADTSATSNNQAANVNNIAFATITFDDSNSSSGFIRAANTFNAACTANANAVNGSSSSISDNTASIADTCHIPPAPRLGSNDAIIAHDNDDGSGGNSIINTYGTDSNNNSISSSISDNTPRFVDTTRALNTDAVTSSIADTARTLDTNHADTKSNTSSRSHSNATFAAGIVNALTLNTIATARDDKPKHECACMPPLDVIPQVPPIAAPQLDKPEEPPPALHVAQTSLPSPAKPTAITPPPSSTCALSIPLLTHMQTRSPVLIAEQSRHPLQEDGSSQGSTTRFANPSSSLDKAISLVGRHLRTSLL